MKTGRSGVGLGAASNCEGRFPVLFRRREALTKQQCWESKSCGREPGGPKVEEMGVCPASTDSRLDGCNGGINAGRACWVVAGTMCNGEIQGTHAQKAAGCLGCDFYQDVRDEEGDDYLFTSALLLRLMDEEGIA